MKQRPWRAPTLAEVRAPTTQYVWHHRGHYPAISLAKYTRGGTRCGVEMSARWTLGNHPFQGLWEAVCKQRYLREHVAFIYECMWLLLSWTRFITYDVHVREEAATFALMCVCVCVTPKRWENHRHATLPGGRTFRVLEGRLARSRGGNQIRINQCPQECQGTLLSPATISVVRDPKARPC